MFHAYAVTYKGQNLGGNTFGVVSDLRSALCSVLQVLGKPLQPEGLTMRGAIPPFPHWYPVRHAQIRTVTPANHYLTRL
jgi:hypothetical protein